MLIFFLLFFFTEYTDPPHGVPVRFWLYPLPGSDVIYRELSDSVAWRVTRILEEYEALRVCLQVLRERKASQALPKMTLVVKQLQTSFTEFLRTFKNEIKNLRSEIKGKAKEEETLIGVLEVLQQLPIAPGKIQKWIESREREANIVELVWEHSKPRRKVTPAKCRVTLVVDTYCTQTDDYLQTMDMTVKKYRDGAGHIRNLKTNMPEASYGTFECMFDDDCKNMATEFSHCYKEHQGQNDVQFELSDDGMDKPRQGRMYFEIHDKASHIVQFREGSLLPDGVSSLVVRVDDNTGLNKRVLFQVFILITQPVN